MENENEKNELDLEVSGGIEDSRNEEVIAVDEAVETNAELSDEAVETSQEQSDNVDTDTEPVTSTCPKCGTEILDGQLFCPKCGKKVRNKNKNKKTKNNKKVAKIIIPIVIVVVLALAITIPLAIRGKQAKSITLSKTEQTVSVGDSVKLSATIDPEDTKDKSVTWTSSNSSIAEVKDGTIFGKNEGQCIIKVSTSNNKTAECLLVVKKAKPDLRKIFTDCCDIEYADYGLDGSYLLIDSNPSDSNYNQYEYEALIALDSVFKELNLPDSVMQKISETRAIDGRQSWSNDEIELSWTYHPDKGLEVLISLK